MAGRSLDKLASSAADCGLSSTKSAGAVTVRCPKAGKAERPAYHPCDIEKLRLDLSAGQTKRTMLLTSQRRREPVARTVAAAYRADLTRFDLVIEALSDVKSTTQTHGRAGPAANVKANPLKIKLQAANAGQHVIKMPPHPHVAIGGDGLNVRGHGDAPVNSEIWAKPPSHARRSPWVAVWPLDDTRNSKHTLAARSCGVRKGPAKIYLAMQLVVKPSEEWKITLGVPGRHGGSRMVDRNVLARTGPNGNSVATVTTSMKKRGDTTSTATQSRIGQDHYGESYSVRQATTRPLTVTSRTLTERDSTWNSPSFEDTNKKEAGKISIERKVAGRNPRSI